MKVVAISGSPSATSRTEKLTDFVLGQFRAQDVSVSHIRVRELPANALLRGDVADRLLAPAIAQVEEAHGVVVATPIFKASCSGLLKAFMDVLPQFALSGKSVLPLATGGSLAHVLALDYAVRPILMSMGARHIVQGYFVQEANMKIENGELLLNAEGLKGLRPAVSHFMLSLSEDPSVAYLGHPRPPELLGDGRSARV